jgi:CIC family chloride channel protein
MSGILIGVSAFLLKWVITEMADLATLKLPSMLAGTGFRWVLFCFPLIGIVSASLYQKFVIKKDLSREIERLRLSLSHGKYEMARDLIYSPTIASSLTLSLGGSAGAEAPAAYTGAAVSSNIGMRAGYSGPELAVLTGCGSGAGIAAIFRAPIGGALFTIEVLGLTLSTSMITLLMMMCMASALTTYILFGATTDVTIASVGGGYNAWGWAVIMVIAVVGGVYAWYYRRMMDMVAQLLKRVDNRWTKNVIAGVCLSIVIALFPALYGEGYGVIDAVVSGDMSRVMSSSIVHHVPDTALIMVVFLVGILALKGIATSLTTNGGGVAGDFAPTFFAGAMVGMLVWSLATLVSPSTPMIADCVIVGMATVMAAVIGAPLTAIFLTIEMTANYQSILPVTIAALVAFGIVRFLETGRRARIKKPEPPKQDGKSTEEVDPEKESEPGTPPVMSD